MVLPRMLMLEFIAGIPQQFVQVTIQGLVRRLVITLLPSIYDLVIQLQKLAQEFFIDLDASFDQSSSSTNSWRNVIFNFQPSHGQHTDNATIFLIISFFWFLSLVFTGFCACCLGCGCSWFIRSLYTSAISTLSSAYTSLFSCLSSFWALVSRSFLTPRSDDLWDLEALAIQLTTSDRPARQWAATRSGTSEEAITAWALDWQRIRRGPRQV